MAFKALKAGYLYFFEMKKLVISLLAIIYMGSSTGATIHVHYCMGKVAGWGFGLADKKQCGKCGMTKVEKEDNGCCKDEQQFHKNQADQQSCAGTCSAVKIIIAEGLAYTAFSVPERIITSSTGHLSNWSSPPGQPPVYIRNCVFRI